VRRDGVRVLPGDAVTVWFTADSHYSHRNVIDYCSRPFATVEEMDEALIDRWNSVVGPGDLVYHLGDFALGRPEAAVAIASRLRGNKYLVFGNHDKYTRKNDAFLKHFVWARDLTQIQIRDQKITLCHYAMLTWASAHHGAWSLHGHSHGSLPDDPNALRLDVGVDVWDFFPVSFETLQDRMMTKNFRPNDHHGETP
jgi:calcineurin-like phosphoesterase family protein